VFIARGWPFIGQERTAARALFRRPTDELVAIFEVKGGRTPGGDRQASASIHEGIAQMLAHQGDTAQVMVLADGLIALGDIFGRAQQQEVAMLENVLLVWRNVAAFAFAHGASIKKWKADVPQKMLTSSIAMCPIVEKPRPDSTAASSCKSCTRG
jgi:hypothetical protein